MTLEEELAAFAAEPPAPPPPPKAKPTPAPAPKPKSKVPETIRTIIEQCGGMGLRGAFVYVGAQEFSYKCPNVRGECRGSPSNITEHGLVDYGVGLTFRVNGKRGANWRMMIAYEPDDTYSVYLWRRAYPKEEEKGLRGVVLESADDVYCDTIKSVVEQMYDRAIKEHNDGFIPC
jgi:hypothetical protein